ncbi:MAG: response regulator [Syntrophales bacterium]
MADDMPDILLVDDDRYSVEFILEAMKKHDLSNRLKVFRDGGEVLSYLFPAEGNNRRDSYELPKVIILDLRLPKVNGFDVLRIIRSSEKTKMIPVVVFTSSTDDSERVESYRLGANSYIVKPIDYENFVSTAAEIGLYWTSQNMPP